MLATEEILVNVVETPPTLAERVDRLLDPRNEFNLKCLMVTPEFTAARFKLLLMREELERDGYLSDRRLGYLSYVEEHFQNIQPHVKVIQIEGEDCEVLFLTEIPNYGVTGILASIPVAG